MTREISEVVVMITTLRDDDNPTNEIYRYDIYDDGKDIIEFIESKVDIDTNYSGRYALDDTYRWSRFKHEVI